MIGASIGFLSAPDPTLRSRPSAPHTGVLGPTAGDFALRRCSGNLRGIGNFDLPETFHVSRIAAALGHT